MTCASCGTDHHGAYSKQKFVASMLDLTLHQIGKLRSDPNLRYSIKGPNAQGQIAKSL